MSLSLELEIAALECQPLALDQVDLQLKSLRLRAKNASLTQKFSTQRPTAKQGGIAILPLMNMIVQRPGLLTLFGLATSTQQFTQSLRAVLADPGISQIIIECDSPGGGVYGVQELADEICKARSTKPIIGIANSLAASAAYWILSQCSELYCSPSGEVGSIGVYTSHADVCKALEQEGVKISLISAGAFKTEGSPYGPLSGPARAAIQKSVDNYYSMFTKSVSRGRGVGIAQARDGMGQGRCLSAADALKQQMIDGVATRDQLIGLMSRTANSHTRADARALTLH